MSSLEFAALNASSDASSAIVYYTKKTGSRTIVLDLTRYSECPRNHFSFMINGQRFNAKDNKPLFFCHPNLIQSLGSNTVPMDPFEPRVDTAWYRRLFESATRTSLLGIRHGQIFHHTFSKNQAMHTTFSHNSEVFSLKSQHNRHPDANNNHARSPCLLSSSAISTYPVSVLAILPPKSAGPGFSSPRSPFHIGN